MLLLKEREDSSDRKEQKMFIEVQTVAAEAFSKINLALPPGPSAVTHLHPLPHAPVTGQYKRQEFAKDSG